MLHEGTDCQYQGGEDVYVERGAFHNLPDSDYATCAPCNRIPGNHMEDRETPRHVGGGSTPYYGQVDGSHVQAVPLHLPPGQVGGAPGKDLSQPGAQVEAMERGAMDNRA